MRLLSNGIRNLTGTPNNQDLKTKSGFHEISHYLVSGLQSKRKNKVGQKFTQFFALKPKVTWIHNKEN